MFIGDDDVNVVCESEVLELIDKKSIEHRKVPLVNGKS